MLAEAGYTAWAPNLRGYGNSARPEPMSAYAIEDLMEDVAGLIDESGLSETVLIAQPSGYPKPSTKVPFPECRSE